MQYGSKWIIAAYRCLFLLLLIITMLSIIWNVKPPGKLDAVREEWEKQSILQDTYRLTASNLCLVRFFPNSYSHSIWFELGFNRFFDVFLRHLSGTAAVNKKLVQSWSNGSCAVLKRNRKPIKHASTLLNTPIKERIKLITFCQLAI